VTTSVIHTAAPNGTWKVGDKRRQSRETTYDDEVFMTRRFNVTPITTAQNLIVRCDKSEATITNISLRVDLTERPRDASCMSAVCT